MHNQKMLLAAELGNVAVLEEILSNGQNPNTRFADGGTALHVAARYGHESAVKLLLEEGANPNLRDMVGATPLHWAAMLAPPALLDVLLERGADPLIKDDDGETPLDWAEREGNDRHASKLREAMEASREAALEALQRQAQELGFDYY